MKKKIAVVFGTMIVGGAEKACVNFLKAIDKSRFEVFLFTRVANNPYIAQIPSHIEVCDIGKIDTKQLLIDDIRHLRFVKAAKSLTNRVLCRLTSNEYNCLAYSCKTYMLSDVEFDCAIAYKANYPDTASTLYSLRAQKKAAIIHSDLALDENGAKGFSSHLQRFDKIFCVSEAQRARSVQMYPNLKSKLEVMHNVMDSEEIISKAQSSSDPMKHPCIVTVGRLSAEKGQDMIPATVRTLRDAGYDIQWYLVGDGPLRETVVQEIEKYGVADHVILLGTKENPYPYIKNCDIYVQTSLAEGWCLTTQEARILCKPIVTTNLPVMKEQFVNRLNGLIVDETTPEALAEGIKTLLDHPEMAKLFESQLAKEAHANKEELKKLYAFIED